MGTVKQGAKQAVEKCMKITARDVVVIVTDEKTKKMSQAIADECKKKTSHIHFFVLENFGKRPIKKLPNQIKDAVKHATAVFYMADSKPGEKSSLRLPIVEYGVHKGKARQAHMPGVTKQIMKQGMTTDYDKIKKMCKKLYNIVSKAAEINVTTKKGTNITASFNPKWKWIIADGDIASVSTGWSNLPDGEVFTAPKNVNGHVVVDGCLGDYFIEYGKLKNPVHIDIENNYVTNIETKDKKLQARLRKYIRQDKNASRIGEFAIGTNLGLKKIIGNLLQDEKFPSVHIAMGDCYPDETGCPYPSKGHLDVVILKTTITAKLRNGKIKEIMKNGKFVI